MGTAAPGVGAGLPLQAALLIDADNFSDTVAIHAAWSQLEARAGRVSVCRAYGSASRLQTLAAMWRNLGARVFPNLTLDKNTTDSALIADAVALHFQQGIRLFVIASGDADFAPLAVRLREWGCEVWCCSMEGVLFANAHSYYDRVAKFAPQPVAAVAIHPPTSASMAVPVPVPIAPPSPLLSPIPDDVQRILKIAPGLRHTPQALNTLVPLLREKNILGKTTKSGRFFAQYPAQFALTPTDQPTHLRYLGP